tara:strand:- start:72 stop:236 length:165 start_codon:yes stop_codon:yes gene_type:complete
MPHSNPSAAETPPSADYPLMFAVLIALAIMGIGLYYVVVVLEKIFAGWAERDAT